MSEKQALRRQMRAVRDAIPSELRKTVSRRICAAAAELVRPGETAFVYASIGSEVQTEALICALWTKGCRVGLPLITGEGRMEAASYAPGDALQRDRYGIPAPMHGETIPTAQIDVAFVPLLAFDGRGNRLGYGGGYYDRWLARTNARRIGLAYARQFVERISIDEWDWPLNVVLTEEREFCFR